MQAYANVTQLRAAAKLKLIHLSEIQPSEEWACYIDSDPVNWIQRHFYIPETNGPMQLYPFHVAGLREALAREDNGDFRYSTIVWSALKKSFKSSIAAAVALYTAWQKPWSTVRVIANDLKGADSRVFHYIRRCLELHPNMKEQAHVVNYKITLSNHSTIEAVPIDPKGESGGGDDLVVYSEIWGWNSKAALKMWSETTLSPMKYGKSLRFCETYAGELGEAPVLEKLWEQGVKDGMCIDPVNEFYRNDRLLVIWNTKPTTPYQTPEYYAQESANLLESEFRRFHKNEWGSSTSSFIPSEWIDNCRVDPLPAYEKNEPWVIALDAAISGDCFGMVAVTRKNGIVIPRYIRKWTPPPGGEIAYNAPKGTPPEQDETPSGELRRLCQRHSVVKVVYDIFQLYSFCNQMKEELIVFFEPFSQSGPRLQADKALRDAIRDKKFIYDGNHDLREHITNANAKSEGDEKIRLVKRKKSMKIDLAVCASMANYTAVKMNIG